MSTVPIAQGPVDVNVRPCTCHPDDNPPQPCAKQYALGECRRIEAEGFDEYIGDEPACLVCGGEGWVEGRDHLDWDEDGYDDMIECTSCQGSGLAKDMTWC